MSDLKRFGNEVWDRLFDLLYDCNETVSDAEVKARLQRAGIDMRPAYRRMHQIVAERKARAALLEARARRVSVVDGVRDIVAEKVENLRDGVTQLIGRLFTGADLVANHHKLEKTASDEDLQSMMDDLTRLAQLREQKKDDSTSK
jgi:hypothetical protein